MSSAWILLILAGIAEIGWPVGLKISQQPGKSLLGAMIAVVFMSISVCLMWIVQKEIPIGTSYAVWASIGAVGTFLVGVFFFGDAMSMSRLVAIGLIVAGVVILKAGY